MRALLSDTDKVGRELLGKRAKGEKREQNNAERKS
jgi:hypothetical protein